MEFLPNAGNLSRIGISRFEPAGAEPLSLFWFNLPQESTGDIGGLRLRLAEATYAPREISFEEFLTRFFSRKAGFANFFDLLFRVVAPALELKRQPGFADLLNVFCRNHASSHIHSFHTRDMIHGALLLQRNSRGKPRCKAIALIGSDVAVTHPKSSLPLIGEVDRGFIFPLDISSEIPSLKFCILVLEDAIVVAALTVHSYPSVRTLFAKAGLLPPAVSSALYAWADSNERRRIDVAMASLPSKPSISQSIPNQVRIEVQTTVSLECGLFVAGWWIDASKSIRSVDVIDHSLEEQRASDIWNVYKSHVKVEGKEYYVSRFAVFLRRRPKQRGLLRPTLLVTMAGGEVYSVMTPIGSMDPVLQRKAIIDQVDERALTLRLLQETFLPAVTALQDDINSQQEIEEDLCLSKASLQKVSIIIPVYRNFEFIRNQLFAFYSDPFIKSSCEIIYVNDDPAYGPHLRSLLEGYGKLFDLDIRLLLLARNGGYSLANNLAAAVAKGELLVLMNSDIVPEKAGWLEGVISRLGELPRYSVIGPKLLYADGTLQHAGMYFLKHFSGFWQNMHYYKGYGRDFLPANYDRVVGAVTGACLILNKSDFLDVGGFSTEYVIGDYEDSDLCFKLRQKGGTCVYAANIALYHFERQSMQVNTLRNDSTTSAYNRALNFLKWKDSGLEAGYLQG